MTTLRSQRLLDALVPYPRLLIVAHDNPDPDAIASGWAIGWMLRERLARKVRFIAGGGIVRAENRQMVKLLDPPIELIDELEIQENTAAILVDCASTAENHVLSDTDVCPVAVIDHHQTNDRRTRLAFRDVRPAVAASASIAASYLREQELVPHSRLATALLYAIGTEAQGSQTHYSRLDRRVVSWLSGVADLETLAEIENAPLTPEYYSDLVLALQCTFTYDTAALCFLPRAEGAEIIGEVADLLVRCEGIDKVMCAGILGDDLLLSVRTVQGAGNASRLVHETLIGLGKGGGHEHRAGGKIRRRQCVCTTEQLRDDLRNRWLKACGIQRQRGKRLVARKEIVRHL